MSGVAALLNLAAMFLFADAYLQHHEPVYALFVVAMFVAFVICVALI